jgi:hypothetical protein
MGERRVGRLMHAATRLLTVATLVAVFALVLPTAIAANVAPLPTSELGGSVSGATGSMPALLVKLNSSGFAGYEAGLSPNRSVTNLNASWIQPTVNCTKGNSSALFAAFVVSRSTADIAGTGVSCAGGVSSAFAFYDYASASASRSITKIPSRTLPVAAGSVVRVSITHTAGTITIVIRVGTHGVTKTHASTARDYIVDVSVASNPTKGKRMPLANFGTVAFGSAFTKVSGTNTAKINGTTKAIGAFPYVAEVTSVDAKSHVLAAPSALTGGMGSFAVTWKRST